MNIGFDTRLPFQALLVAGSLFAVCGFAPEGGARDPRVQDRLYGHLDTAERAALVGNDTEAAAYAEMILLRREITVYVDDANVPWQIKEDAARAIRTAAVNWEDSVRREIKFRFVPFRDADVIVSYAGKVRHDGKDAAGTVRWTRQVISLGSGEYRYEVRANITLRTYTPNGETMNYRQMLHTAGHELGHILGLEDSNKVGELMGPLRLDRPVERATRAERDSLLALRQQAADILARIEVVSAEEEAKPEDPIRVLVVSDQADTGEAKKPSLRSDRDRRGAGVVRRTVRDRKAEPRKKDFTITGMAR